MCSCLYRSLKGVKVSLVKTAVWAGRSVTVGEKFGTPVEWAQVRNAPPKRLGSTECWHLLVV